MWRFVLFSCEGNFFYVWSGLVSLCFLYNAICIPLRFSFDIYSSHHGWFIGDYLWADFVYVLDMVLINTHLQFTNNEVQVGRLVYIISIK